MAIWAEQPEVLRTMVLRIAIAMIHLKWNLACHRIQLRPSTEQTFFPGHLG
jgi:hypothetical protein